MHPFSLTVSVTPPGSLDADSLVNALVTDNRVRGATARTPPADPDSRIDVFLSVWAASPEDAADLAIALVHSLAPDRTVEILGGNVFGFGGHS